jgi:hypothetical protein
MAILKKAKWDIGVAISKGKQSISLLETYQSAFGARLTTNDIDQHKANVTELEKRRAGQQENLSNQKSKTSGQEVAINLLHNRVASIRNVVKGNNPSPEILKAYGVGEKFILTVSGVTAAANMVITAYHDHTSWSNAAGLIDADMEEISALADALNTADNVQETTIFNRKSATMDKNTLHRAVEDMVTKISTLGVHEFAIKNPGVAALFADLIPGSSKPAKKATEETSPAT